MIKLLSLALLFIGLTIHGQTCKPNKNLKDTIFVIGDKIKLPEIIYDLSFPVSPQTKDSLRPVAEFIKKHKTIKFEIGCHTDFRGAKESNRQISEFRAVHVYEFFVMEYNIDADKLSYKGYGESCPLISEEEISKAATNEEKGKLYRLNQRTELTVVELK